ncbi:hypothetical protein ACQP25_44900 (plasmid) [Microtetraspora malaysiensis]|uniref:hypothetical protein n=1 Tax=Microtetraspora malaysiensis TaxID=161358 RepID=UPI003D91D88C
MEHTNGVWWRVGLAAGVLAGLVGWGFALHALTPPLARALVERVQAAHSPHLGGAK